MITPQEMRLRLGIDPSDDAQDPLIALLLEGAGISSATLSGAAEHYRSSYSDDVMGALRALRHPGTVRRGTHA